MNPPAAPPGRSLAGPILSLRDGVFGYADAPVVRDATLTVQPGEVVAVLGANGSGKSTLVKGLLGLADQLGGTVEWFGIPRSEFADHARIGYVPQRHSLSGSVTATAEEVVATGRLARTSWWVRWGRSTAQDRQVVARSLDVVGLADRAGTDVARLSGGQQRRVLIARALASQPDVLVMDEPTAGVDTANQQILAEVLGRLAAQGGTMLIVTHEMDAFADVVTRVVVLSGGRLTFDGPVAAFLDRQGGVLHENHTHHHDEDDLGSDGRSVTGTATTGPLTRPARPERHDD